MAHFIDDLSFEFNEAFAGHVGLANAVPWCR
jgi:hypothetical protein